jgi:surfeit locus 1 family protein
VYRFLLRPLWILSHIFVIGSVILMINLGFWQLGRLDERKASNVTIVEAEKSPAVPIAELLPEGVDSSSGAVDEASYRSVLVTGTYRADQQVLIPNRTYNGGAGFWVITPIVQSDGTAVAVNRGWIPYSFTADGPWDEFAPPTGTVSISGMVRPPQAREASGIVSGPKDPTEGTLRSLARVDIGRLGQQIDEKLWPLYINLQQQQPEQPGQLPVPVPRPELSEGPHLGYAGQWFIFSTLTIIVYPLLLRRVAKRRQREDDDTDDGTDGTDGGTDGDGFVTAAPTASGTLPDGSALS